MKELEARSGQECQDIPRLDDNKLDRWVLRQENDDQLNYQVNQVAYRQAVLSRLESLTSKNLSSSGPGTMPQDPHPPSDPSRPNELDLVAQKFHAQARKQEALLRHHTTDLPISAPDLSNQLSHRDKLFQDLKHLQS